MKQKAALKSKSKVGRRAEKKLPFSLRLAPSLRAKLEQEAKAHGRELSDEITMRVVKTFGTEDALAAVFSAPHIRALCTAFAQLITGVELSTGVTWRRDPFTFEAVQAGEKVLADGLGPRGEVRTPERISQGRLKPRHPDPLRDAQMLGESIAYGVLDSIQLHRDPPPAVLRPGLELASSFYIYPQINQDLSNEGGPIGKAARRKGR